MNINDYFVNKKEIDANTSEELESVEEPKYVIENFDLYDLCVKKQKINYKLFIKNKNLLSNIKIKLQWVKSPFGVEKYLFKEIINLEFTNYKNKNYSYNNYSKINQIEEAFNKLNTDSVHTNNFKHLYGSFLNDLKGLDFLPSIKMRPDKFDPLFRVHLKKTKNLITTKIFKKNKDKYEHGSIHDIKDKMLEVELELSTIWIKNNDYGLIWLIDRIIIN
jgi:hypothetical protein